jgi:hypothetical protein
MSELRHINDLLPSAIDEIDRNHSSAEWRAAQRNRNITARNRNMKKIADMLDMPYQEMPLITQQEPA